MLPTRSLEQDELSNRALGKERAEGAHVWWVLAPDLVPIAFGSGYPDGDPDPLAGLAAARRLLGWPLAAREQVQAGSDPVRVATRGYSTAAAHAAGVEGRLGRLAVGSWCDLTVLDLDPQRASLEELEAGSVLATVVAGEVVWSAPTR
jgi:predicted amidohydrolase YtcJ